MIFPIVLQEKTKYPKIKESIGQVPYHLQTSKDDDKHHQTTTLMRQKTQIHVMIKRMIVGFGITLKDCMIHLDNSPIEDIKINKEKSI